MENIVKPRSPALSRRRARALVVLGIVVVGAGVWYNHTRPGDIVNVTPHHPQLVGLGVGSYRGVYLGEAYAAVVHTLGPPSKQAACPTPIGSSPDAQPPDCLAFSQSIDYPDLALSLHANQVVLIVITSHAAQTKLGVGVGDSLAIARRAYPHLMCLSHDAGMDEQFGPPECLAHLHPGVNIQLVGDPIFTILLHGTGPGTS